MNIDISKYPVRRTNPIVMGSYGLPEDTERYIVKGQGLIGIDLDKGDHLYLKNLEGKEYDEDIKQALIELEENEEAT